MRAIWIVAAFIIACAFGSPAFADWQYAKWGMTPAEVIEASGGKAVTDDRPASNDQDGVIKLNASHSAGDYEFLALFKFDRKTDKLTTVQLLLHKPARCDALRDELIAKYGSPARTTSSSLWKEATWLEASDNNRIAIMNLGSGALCSLEYSALSSSSRKGL